MNILEFIILVSVGIVVVTVGIDVCSQIWAEKREERKAQWARIQEAETLLYASILKRFEERSKTTPVNVIELNVVALPKKPTGGRHRLSAA